jgi:Protein of unknown function (DUF732)
MVSKTEVTVRKSRAAASAGVAINRRMSRMNRLAGLAIPAVILLGACGSGSSSPAPSAPVATAPPGETGAPLTQQYVATLSSDGIHFDPGDEIAIGNSACTYLQEGHSPEEEEQQYLINGSNVSGTFTVTQAADLVNAAMADLCPYDGGL